LITPVDDFDDGRPDLAPEDPLADVLRPASRHLAPPAGSYERIRRGARRRRTLRAAAAAGATCAVAALAVLLPLRPATSGPSQPVIPLAPPSASGPATVPARTPPPSPVAEDPTEGAAATRRAEDRLRTPATDTDASTGGRRLDRSPGPSPSSTPSQLRSRAEVSPAPSEVDERSAAPSAVSGRR
jgi:hypothetical protein